MKTSLWRWLAVAAAIIVADRLTKVWVLAAFRPGEQRVVTDFFNLTLAFNPGAAFSFLAGADGWQRWLFTAIAIAASAAIIWMLKRGGNTSYSLGLTLILGGALGNLWDRLTIGNVVDFLLFHYQNWAWPAFNVADSAITCGAALLIFDSFRTRHGNEGANDAKY